MKLRTEITIFVFLILLFTVGSLTLLSYFQIKSVFEDQLEEKLITIANYASEDFMVKDALNNGKKIDLNLNEHIEVIRKKSNVDFIVIIDMNGIRLTHPKEKNIGLKFKGGDEKRVLEKGEEYISLAMGTLGISVRSFAPVFVNGQQIGAVCVGKTVDEINKSTYEKIKQFYPVIAVGVLMSFSFAIILTTNIKDEILGLEPREIRLLLKEKEAILENVKEGIITLNEHGNLIQYNKEAARILGLTNKDMNLRINEFIHRENISNLLNDVENSEDFEIRTRPGATILCKNNILRNDKNKVIGQVINFRDLTEVKKLAEELTGIKKMAWSLRAQNHEFMNKLHTISGLIQLEEYDEAIKYISYTANNGNDITSIITGKIKNINIAALLLSKFYKAEEQRVKLEIDKQSFLNKVPNNTSEDDINSVIGNLIENSLDVVKVDGTGKIYFKIIESNEKLIIEVSDNGPGIPDEIKEKIYERSFSTKSGQRGYGLYIVKNIIENAKGTIELSVNDGTYWHIEIPKVDGDIF